MKDELGDYFKEIEGYSKHVIAGDYFVIRIDGKAFHTFTRGLEKPFDYELTKAMDETTRSLCRDSDVPVLFAYTQSDEISLLIKNGQEPWFGGVLQKISSIAASYTSAFFNSRFSNSDRLAVFDARTFALEREEVADYFRWRKTDANKNAISALARTLYSHKELQGRNKEELLGMIAEKAPESLPIAPRNFNGAYFYSEVTPMPVEFIDQRTGRVETTVANRRVWHRGTDNGMLDLLVNHVVPSDV